MDNYICKIATVEDIIKMYDEETKEYNDKDKMIIWRNMTIERVKNGSSIIYIGLKDGIVISECAATLDSSLVDNSENLVDENTAYLHAFNTKDEFQNQGYFSRLFKFMISDLKDRGYKKVTLGVEKDSIKNKTIYNKYGFTEYIKTIPEIYSDGTSMNIDYYGKRI